MPETTQAPALDVAASQHAGIRRVPAELWMVGVIVGYVGSHLFDKVAVVGTDPLFASFLRRLPSLLLGAVLIWLQGTYVQLMPSSKKYVGLKNVLLFVVAGVLSTLGMFTYFYAMRFGGVVITVPFSQSIVVWGALMGWICLREKMSALGLLGVGLLVTGLTLLSYGQSAGVPVSQDWLYAIPLALFTALSWGIAGAFWRMGQLWGADHSTSIFVQFGTSILFTSLILAGMGKLSVIRETSLNDYGALIASGALSGILAIYCIFAALRVMSVVRVYAWNSLTPVFASVLAFLLLGEYINREMLVGIVLASMGVALVQAFKPEEKRV